MEFGVQQWRPSNKFDQEIWSWKRPLNSYSVFISHEIMVIIAMLIINHNLYILYIYIYEYIHVYESISLHIYDLYKREQKTWFTALFSTYMEGLHPIDVILFEKFLLYLIYNVLLISAIQRSDPVLYIFFFSYYLLSCSLCYTARPPCFSILNVVVYMY